MEREGSLAREVRAGLGKENTLPKVAMKVDGINNRFNRLDERYFGKSKRQHVREFGAVIGLICLIIAGYFAYRGATLAKVVFYGGGGVVFYWLSIAAPSLIYYLWAGWMKMATLLGFVMTTLILSLSWFVVFVPMALLARLMKYKGVDSTFGSSTTTTYWDVKDPKLNDFSLLKRQY
ncbi:MAG TPA: SxtJ family membrane protein [Oligoflexia bacterium]|nr:SxtJ family membrane protein [Oligoflexia bacterium]HMP27469.1 SxtJ family membrane protein [Oligoflexia bacterium]